MRPDEHYTVSGARLSLEGDGVSYEVSSALLIRYKRAGTPLAETHVTFMLTSTGQRLTLVLDDTTRRALAHALAKL